MVAIYSHRYGRIDQGLKSHGTKANKHTCDLIMSQNNNVRDALNKLIKYDFEFIFPTIHACNYLGTNAAFKMFK